jgi:hypothetical protein
MAELRGRALIESRYGPLGTGAQLMVVEGTEYDMPTLLARMGLNFEDSRGIDVVEVSPGRYVVRYYDGEDQRIVAHEFDDQFRFLGELRAHIAEWIGDDGYFEWFRHFRVRCPADL